MFQQATHRWFADNFPSPTEVQQRGWAEIATGQHALLVAPTGSGKTLAAFLAGIDSLGQLPAETARGVRVLYVSPLKALVYDIERNLRAPLVGIARAAERLELPFRTPTVAVRTGDTPQRERQRQAREPGDILVTTPESLYLILGSKAADTLRTVETVIIDEIHALAPTKRGAHLALSLERLANLTETDPQRIGLSATVRPLDVVANFLGGDRRVSIVDASSPPNMALAVTVPVPDMEQVPQPTVPQTGGSILGELYSREVGTPAAERGIWPAVYPQLLSSIQAHRATIVFVNSRGLCERLAQKLNELADEELVRAHHGSISHEKRADIEESLKAGQLRGIVATSSLELGIDMGAVDQVLLVESPGSVARGLQRIGRAGHQVGAVSSGQIFPKFRGDLLECAVISQRMLAGELEALAMPGNPLDVLSQQIVAMCSQHEQSIDELLRIVSRAAPYRELSRSALEAVLDMLSGRYPSSDFADLKPLLSWDRATDTLAPRRGAAMVARMNAGTIPDRGSFAVTLGEDGPRVGELDEEMVFETRLGDVIMLGASSWRVEAISRDRVAVSPAPGEPGRLPFWRGEGPGRPVELGRAIGEFLRRLSRLGRSRRVDWLETHTPLDRFAAENLATYIDEQKTQTGTLPTDRAITIERFRDELGDWRICILTPFGARIHAPWSIALQQALSARAGYEIQVMYTDDGIVLRFADTEELPDVDTLIPDPDEIHELVTDQLAGTALFAGLFRENAVRSLLLRRRAPGQRSPLWAQRLKAQNLLATVRQYPSFPVVIETYRHALADVFDLPALKTLLREIRSREIAIDDVQTSSASPFARSLVFAYVAAYLYEQDAPLAERKAQALTLDRALLGELLGQAELRELIDPQVLAELEQELQHVADDYRARDRDELHDILRRLGDLDADELAERSDKDPRPWLQELTTQRRAVEVTVAGQRRWIAADDAGLYRDALGVIAPGGLPDAFLESVDQPLSRLLRRYARHHGPFLTAAPAARFDLRPAQVEPVLLQLEAAGELVRGEIRPGGAALDWCDAEVLRRLKRRTLARLRDEVAPVDTATLATFLPRWQGVGDERQGSARLRDVIAQLQDLPLPWSMWNLVVLPQRVPGFRLDMLDMLAASGAVVWVGRGATGARDGRVALYLREQVRDLLPVDRDYEPPSPLHAAILNFLTNRGASFLMELQDGVRTSTTEADAAEFGAALWDLVWAGQITNDTFAPLRGFGRRPGRRRSRRDNMLAGGRWSLVSELVTQDPAPTARAVARAKLLLERYGIVSRECVVAEDLPGGFTPVYKVLAEMEDQGQVRRGYFVEGLSGAQFGHVGAVDRLRVYRADAEERDRPIDVDDIQMLAAMDPANPFGALVSWPRVAAPEQAKPRRVAGAWVLLARGHPLLYVAQRGRRVLSFPDNLRIADGALAAAISALRRLPRDGRRGLLSIERIDGVSAADSSFLPAFRAGGFELDYRGLIDIQTPASPVARQA
ncbi:MAG: DEAD/DEAH box helicase [Gammaproteobacteria bacterium]|nr:DEAD/DEAH box helicase [Gammaproteobacteria bacterium]